MKSITYEEFLEFDPCYLRNREKKALMDSIARRKERWTALDILGLEEIPDEDKFWCVLREELIDEQTLHKFACACAERALSRVENPDPRSVAAIEAKRAWMKGEISDAELDAASDAARDAASAAAWDAASDDVRVAAWAAARDAAWDAAWDVAWDAAMAAARDAAWAAARDAAWDAAFAAASAAARAAERAWQVEELKKLLREAQA